MEASGKGGAGANSPGSNGDGFAAIAGGSDQQWERVYAEYGPAVLSFASDYLSCRALAEEVLQHVFVHLWSSSESIDVAGSGSLRSLLLTQVRLRCEEIMGADELRLGDKRHHTGPPFERLPLDERLAISLAHFGKLTYKEAAEVLDCPESRVTCLMRRGLQRMSRGDAEHA